MAIDTDTFYFYYSEGVSYIVWFYGEAELIMDRTFRTFLNINRTEQTIDHT